MSLASLTTRRSTSRQKDSLARRARRKRWALFLLLPYVNFSFARMSLFDRLIASSLPLVPKPLVGHFARSYIAGETLEDQVRVVHSLNSEGFMAASGMLGEFVERREEPKRRPRTTRTFLPGSAKTNWTATSTSSRLISGSRSTKSSATRISAAWLPSRMSTRISSASTWRTRARNSKTSRVSPCG